MKFSTTPARALRRWPVLALAAALACAGGPLCAQSARPAESVAPDATPLKFRDFFKLPVGPRGLEPSARLLGLEGRRVRLVGYMARAEGGDEAIDRTILTPLPVLLGDEDESLADDLPATSVFVHLRQPMAYRPGLVALTGTLQLGPRREPGGRWSFVRIEAEAEAEAADVGNAPPAVSTHSMELPDAALQ